MTNQRLDELIKRIDENAQGRLGTWSLEYEGYTAQVITHEKTDRMRIIVPVAETEDINEDILYRLMQANFDSALDGRYCIAQNVLWSAFIHPLSPLTDEEFVSGLAQAVTLAATYGTTYSSGALIFRGGDSEQKQQEYYRQIMDKGLAI